MRSLCLLALLTAAAGCGSSKPYDLAPVSGRVTLDGKPLANARVTFQPQHDPKAGALSGPESFGETDSDGRYSLTTVFQEAGATVGKSRVMVTTVKYEPVPGNADAVRTIGKELVPNKYYTDKAPLYFDVPGGGSAAANFDLTTK